MTHDKKKRRRTPFNEKAINAWHQDTGGILGEHGRSPARTSVLGGKGTRAFFGRERGTLGRGR